MVSSNTQSDNDCKVRLSECVLQTRSTASTPGHGHLVRITIIAKTVYIGILMKPKKYLFAY